MKTNIIAMEELAELIQVLSKIERFGINDPPNRERLAQEISDCLTAIEIVRQYYMIDVDLIEKGMENKKEKLKLWGN